MVRSRTGRSTWPLAVTVDGHRDILGMWAGDGGEGAKHWLHVLTELKNRGVSDVLMLVCDGLKGLPQAVEAGWPRTIVQTCVVHLLRNSFRYAARQDWDKIARALRPVYTAATEDAATERFMEFADAWGKNYPAIVKLRSDAWAEFVPFLAFEAEIRKVICSTDESSRACGCLGGMVRLPVRDEDLVCAFGLLGCRGLGGASLFVVVGRARRAEVPAPRGCSGGQFQLAALCAVRPGRANA